MGYGNPGEMGLQDRFEAVFGEDWNMAGK